MKLDLQQCPLRMSNCVTIYRIFWTDDLNSWFCHDLKSLAALVLSTKYWCCQIARRHADDQTLSLFKSSRLAHARVSMLSNEESMFCLLDFEHFCRNVLVNEFWCILLNNLLFKRKCSQKTQIKMIFYIFTFNQKFSKIAILILDKYGLGFVMNGN